MEASALSAPAGIGRLSVSGTLLRLRSDEQLVALFRAGHDEAFGVIHDRYRQRLFSYTRQMLGGSRSDAEDALQDVFLRAYNALRADDRPLTLRAWLYRVAHNRCIDQLRRPVPAAADVFDLSRSPLYDPIVESERRESLRRLVEDVRRLPRQQRSALLMRELEGLSYVELSEALNVTVPAVKSLLVRARIGLVEAIEARDTACSEIRTDIAAAHDRGVRASGRTRRHVRECASCRDYRGSLKAVREGFAALTPAAGPLGPLMKLLGIGGATGGGAAAGGVTAVVGAGTATKVVAVVCCAAVVGGGAAEVKHLTQPSGAAPASGPAVTKAGAPAMTPPATVVEPGRHQPAKLAAASAAKPEAAEKAAAVTVAPASAGTGSLGLQAPSDIELQTGGLAAPEEEAPAPALAEPAEPVTGSQAPQTATESSGEDAPAPAPGTAAGPDGGTTGGSAPTAQGASATPPPSGR